MPPVVRRRKATESCRRLGGWLFPHRSEVMLRVLIIVLDLNWIASRCAGAGERQIAFIVLFGVGEPSCR